MWTWLLLALVVPACKPAQEAASPRDPAALYQLAKQLYRAGDWAGAAGAGRDLLALGTGPPPALVAASAELSLAAVLETGQPGLVVEVGEVVVEHPDWLNLPAPLRADWLVAVGEELLLAGNVERAASLLQLSGSGGLELQLLRLLLDRCGGEGRVGEEVEELGDLLDGDWTEEEMTEAKAMLARLQSAALARREEAPAWLDCFLDLQVELGLLPSRLQRPIWYEPGLGTRPVWRLDQFPGPLQQRLAGLAADWRELQTEAERLVRHHNWTLGGWTAGEQELERGGGWHQLVLSGQGYPAPSAAICTAAPRLCALPDLLQGDRQTFGQVKLSVLAGPMRVAAHCGQTNTRLRVHLPLLVPSDPPPRLRVADQTLTWTEGELLVFDDSFEHEVWHESSQARIVLILDLNHPDLTPATKEWYEKNVVVVGKEESGPLFALKEQIKRQEQVKDEF